MNTILALVNDLKMQIDFKELLEIIFIEFDKNPTIWIGIGCSVFVIFLFLSFRLMFSKKSNKEIRKNHTAILNTTQGVIPENSQDLPSFITNENKSNKEFNRVRSFQKSSRIRCHSHMQFFVLDQKTKKFK